MGKVILKRTLTTITINGEKKRIWLLNKNLFEKFNPDLLGLDDISLPSKQVEAIAAVFDLSGFTNFCKQVDPHLVVPEYLSRFLKWLFDEIKGEFVNHKYNEGIELFSELPFLAKFLGDGVLFLFDSTEMNGTEVCNVVVSLNNICIDYKSEFYPDIIKVVVDPPPNLRCGIARGRVFSVGNGDDYVGPCINIASRLQKLSYLTFCFSRRGFDIKEDMSDTTRIKFIEKRVNIRGIGVNELVWIMEDEFNELPDDEKKQFREP